MAENEEHAGAARVQPYEMSSWIDDEVAKRKLYSRRDLSPAGLADQLGISPATLQHIIRHTYHKSVQDYLNDRRVQAAGRLLREQPDMTIDDIADVVGCASAEHFRTLFTQSMGLAPDKYRSQMRGG